MKLGLDQSMGANRGLVTGGIFALTRNPTYIANLALCLGWVLLAASWPAALAAGSLGRALRLRRALRGKMARPHLREDYEAYRAGVKRWAL
jgi:protein-S-isoprenylcysteine O-methyltransferase Ste14